MLRFIRFFSIALLLVTAGYVFLIQPRQQGAMQRVEIGGAFSLLNQEGERVTDASLKGKPMLVYFGFTFCPDICPTGLLAMQGAAKILGEAAPQQVFISVDPARDTVAQMHEFAKNFPGLIALTGSVEEAKQAALAYKVYYAKQDAKDGNYMINHSSFIYLMDSEGEYRAHFPHTIAPKKLAREIQKALQ